MYEQFYGFSERPFQLTPDPAYFFESITHKKALSYLGYGLNQGEGFVVITGEVGSGKSTLVAHLKEKLDDRMSVGEVVTSALDGEEMIHVAARSFGLDVEGRDKAAALAAIEHFLHEEARNGKRCLLIVDESQNLSIGALEELRMLSNFQLGAHPLLQTLLLGQPEFKRLLAGSDELEQLRQRVIAAHHLDAMAKVSHLLLLLAQRHLGQELFLLQFAQVHQLGLGDGHLVGVIVQLAREILTLERRVAVLEFFHIQLGCIFNYWIIRNIGLNHDFTRLIVPARSAGCLINQLENSFAGTKVWKV